MTGTLDQRANAAAVRSLRRPKPAVDPLRAHGTAIDDERRPNGDIERALTVFLAGAECPFTCVFCDLWQWTIDGATPKGALPRQIADSLEAHRGADHIARLKLYNASNFFDARAVPPADHPQIAELCAPFAALTVESHASTIGPPVLRFARRLRGRLEVAIGLESIHPTAMARIGKRMTLDQFDRAADFLRANDIDLRVFVLVGTPFVPANESLEWTVRTATHAAERGAALVALIPVRGGNGEMERLASEGDFVPPALRHLERALDACVGVTPTVVTADLWDVARFAPCDSCRGERVARLERINRSGLAEPPATCAECGGG
ncbi:MAG: radical SAM protein [Gemmatimonadales bacterium]